MVPKKPTTPFGALAFGSDGRVRPQFETLPETAAEQEAAVAEKFVRYDGEWFKGTPTIHALKQDDHDFEIRIGAAIVSVQCVEVVLHDVALPYGATSSYHIWWNGMLRPVDIEKKNDVLVSKIQLKKGKYAKPKDRDLWLLIWTVAPLMDLGDFIQGGVRKSHEPIARARDHVAKNGTGPFDRIFFFPMLTRPNVIWPLANPS